MSEDHERGRFDRITETARDALTVRRVVGEPVVHGETMVIPVARISGGSGMGYGEGAVGGPGRGQDHPGGQGDGGGGGFGVSARALGVYVVRGDSVEWRPAVDVTKIVIGGQLVGALAVVMLARALRRRRR